MKNPVKIIFCLLLALAVIPACKKKMPEGTYETGVRLYINVQGGMCIGDTFYFSTPTYPDANSYNWKFGDGSTASIATPYHVYTKEGIYMVSVTVDGKMSASRNVQAFKDPIHTAKMTNSRTWHLQRRQQGYQLDTTFYWPDEVYSLKYIDKVTVECPGTGVQGKYVYHSGISKGNVLAYTMERDTLYYDHVQDTIRIIKVEGPGKLEGPYTWTTVAYTP
jgi:hypothetical protein